MFWGPFVCAGSCLVTHCCVEPRTVLLCHLFFLLALYCVGSIPGVFATSLLYCFSRRVLGLSLLC